ncbi:N-acetyltransferase [Aestuariicoccus sp. MJ-SS9]|uniref:N-acetyltransferase n=1 Tax=Aestuariicoccus sp. MJ-SS9 TaxID=3079855 RepID=UPI00291231B3|nr:N-acetyltransferase [Aestuariicoccus sp. MJ-SS9]MDU8912617.1 N-acetyltransferase [Aestuariicoccus sp. MJ-SS9]
MTDRTDDPYFGSPEQRALLRRGRALFEILKDEPGYTYYGRTVGLATPGDGGIARLAALARLQGNSNISRLPDDILPELVAATEAAELTPAVYARWVGAEDAIRAARRIVEETSLPPGLTAMWLTPETPRPVLDAFAETALSCAVLPPSLEVLTGCLRPGLTRIAVAEDGSVASCAAAAAYLHPGHPHGATECWWGMLATAERWRGHRLSLRLGAEALLEMRARHGFTTFFTGVEPGNAPSEAVCARIGLQKEPFATLGVADPSLVPGGRMTK